MGPRSHRLSRRAFLGLCVALAGCTGAGGNTTPSPTPTQEPPPEPEETTARPETATATDAGGLTLSSPAFADGEPIPRKYGYQEANVNPPLRISGVPQEAASLALIVDDPDAVEPAGKVWVHWLVWNIAPSQREIPEGWEPDSAVEGTTDFDEQDYGGPAPPDERHTYRFILFALDVRLDLAAGARRPDLEAAMEGHVIAQTTLEGTYAPSS